MKTFTMTLVLLLATSTFALANPDKIICGDVDGDEVVTATDALTVLRKAVGLDDPMYCWCDGKLVFDAPEDDQ